MAFLVYPVKAQLMAIKYTIQGLLIYEAIGFYLSALVLGLLRCRRVSFFVYALGFCAAVSALVYRGMLVGHFPLQNLFEVFLFLGAAVFPLTLFSLKLLKTGDYLTDIVIGIVVLIPAGFIFSGEPHRLPPALQSVLFVPHVLVYMLAYILLTKAAVLGGKQLAGLKGQEAKAHRAACAGFGFLTLGLILGSIWGKHAWGDYWNWDPKELWSLATWLMYVGYFHFRAHFSRRPKACAAWLITGFVFIVITLLWVNLSRLFAGLHSYT